MGRNNEVFASPPQMVEGKQSTGLRLGVVAIFCMQTAKATVIQKKAAWGTVLDAILAPGTITLRVEKKAELRPRGELAVQFPTDGYQVSMAAAALRVAADAIVREPPTGKREVDVIRRDLDWGPAVK